MRRVSAFFDKINTIKSWIDIINIKIEYFNIEIKNIDFWIDIFNL